MITAYENLLHELQRMEQTANRLAGMTPKAVPDSKGYFQHVQRLADLAEYVRKVNDKLNLQLEVWDK